jgi:D-alanyl-D-alanine carboxypeptidase (penicillin-binding protein 5/6)
VIVTTRSLRRIPLQIFFGVLCAALLFDQAVAASPPEVPPPDIAAPAWVLMDYDSGQMLAEHNADKPLAPASLTKLMTAYVLFGKLKAGNLKLDDWIDISQQAWNAKGARLFLRPGSRVRAEDLLKGLIVLSANDAAIALAEATAGSETNFVAEMNAAAVGLGLSDTVFMNATGRDEIDHVSTARDLARLTAALIREFPEYYRWFSLKEYSDGRITQYNHNALLWRDPTVDGVKTGHSRSAGLCLIASARREDMRLIAVVLGARSETDRVKSGQRLLDHGFRHFETRLLYAADVPAVRARVWMGDKSTIPLGAGRDLFLTLPRGWHEKLHARVTVRESLNAPVQRGQDVGTIVLDLDLKPIAEYPLVALKQVGKGNVFQRTIDKIQLWLQ